MVIQQKNNYFLGADDYHRFQTLILSRTGMLLGQRRQHALGRGVTGQAQKMTDGDVGRYFNMLEQTQTDTPLWDDLIQELTIGETYFFRDKSQIRALEKHILPRIIADHQHDRRIRIWSAGCASGEEPYTLAMLLSELIVDLDQWHITILASDIDKAVLEKARRACYRSWSFRQTDEIYKTRYFRKQADVYQLVPQIQKQVHFFYLNLNETVYPSLATNTNALDLILCRNVAIYYSEAVIGRVAERFHRCLIAGGWLMMGASETSIPVFHQYTACNFLGATVFQKCDAPVSTSVRFDMNLMGECGHRETAFPIEKWNMPSQEPTITLDTSASLQVPDIGIDSFPETWGQVPSADAFSGNSVEKHDDRNVFGQGRQFIKEKRYEAAIDCFKTCVASTPRDGASFYQLARIYANLGKMDIAAPFCQQAIDINPLNPEAHYTLALIHQETGDMSSAVAQLKQAVFIDNRFALAHFTLALFYQQMGQMEKVRRHRQQAMQLALDLDPDAILYGSDDLTPRTLLTMLKTMFK
ncbi:hypothetical protein JCM12294_19270 [Desulfocicer niacini]